MAPESAPPPHLAGQVDALWRHTTGGPAIHRVPPDGCLDLIVEVAVGGGPVTARVYGPTSHYDDVALAGGRRLVGVRFAPGVGALALGLRGTDLADGGGDLAQIAPRAAAMVHDAGPDELPARLLAAASWLLAGVRTTAEHRRALRALAAFDAGATVDDAARDLGVATRTLHRDFLTAVGLAPQRTLRIRRARRAAAALERGLAIATVAGACGYADQAHLTRELVALHGTTPGRLVRNLQDRRAAVR